MIIAEEVPPESERGKPKEIVDEVLRTFGTGRWVSIRDIGDRNPETVRVGIYKAARRDGGNVSTRVVTHADGSTVLYIKLLEGADDNGTNIPGEAREPVPESGTAVQEQHEHVVHDEGSGSGGQ